MKHEHEHSRTEEVQLHLRGAIQGLQSIQFLVAEEHGCLKVVQQLTSIIGRLAECRALVAQDHLASCIQSSRSAGSEETLKELEQLLQIFIKTGVQAGSHH